MVEMKDLISIVLGVLLVISLVFNIIYFSTPKECPVCAEDEIECPICEECKECEVCEECEPCTEEECKNTYYYGGGGCNCPACECPACNCHCPDCPQLVCEDGKCPMMYGFGIVNDCEKGDTTVYYCTECDKNGCRSCTKREDIELPLG